MAAEAADKSTPRLRIRYWPIGGRAAPLRLACAIGGVPFEDEWIAGPAYEELKKSGTLSWGTQMPHATINDDKGNEKCTMGQSNAILLYIGTQANPPLVPKGKPLEAAKVVEILSAVEDVQTMLGPSIREKDQTKKLEMRKELLENPAKLPLWLSQFERKLGDNKYFVGDCVTVADVKVFALEFFLSAGILDGIPKDLLSTKYKKLHAHAETMRAIPQVMPFHEAFTNVSKEFKEGKRKDNKVKWTVNEKGNLTAA